MLSNLSIKNYALIDSLDISFESGFAVITGETGAGKSIILGALSQILGERSDVKSIRNSSQKSIIEASFDIRNYDLNSVFEDNDLDYDNEQCILRREVLPNGRSRAFVNDSPVSIAQLRALAIHLIDIHSQHNNLLLSEENYQLSVLDNFADNSAIRNDYVEAYSLYVKVKREYEDLKKSIAESKADEEYLRFQLEKLEKLNLKPGEEAELEEEQSRLTNVTEIKSSLCEALGLLQGDDNISLLPSLKNLVKSFSSISSIVSESESLRNRAESCYIELKDICDTVSQLDSNIVDDPARLEVVNERLNDLFSLKKKHNVDTGDELIAIRDNLAKRIAEVDNFEFDLAQREKALNEAECVLKEKADLLSNSRKDAAKIFREDVKEMAKPLGMSNIECDVEFDSIPYSAKGADRVCFLFAFNKNQKLLPIGNTASGGEISRIMLCVKTLIAKKMLLPTVIFDEIDTGVSGAIANKMGEMMCDMSAKMQVISITHLPQVAALGENHYKVFKFDTAENTVSNIKRLNLDERVVELASMLGAGANDEAAINNAKSLLKRYFK